MRRFYKTAAVREADNGFAIVLDGKPVKTPASADLVLPTRGLAEAVAEEWQTQPEVLRRADMHLTQLASTAIDRLVELRDELVDTIVAYAHTDLVCHRADHPAELVARQTKAWQPLLDWLIETYGAPLIVTAGILPVRQPEVSIVTLRDAIVRRDDHLLSALYNATSVLGSLVIGLALIDGRVDAETAFEASQIDETYQLERWGEDAEAAVRRAAMRREIEATAAYAKLLQE